LPLEKLSEAVKNIEQIFAFCEKMCYNIDTNTIAEVAV